MRNLAKRDGRSASRSSVPVGDIMDSEVVTIEPNATASFAWSQMQSRRAQHLIVMEDGELRGILSDRDLGSVAERSGRVVQDYMTPEIVTVEPKTTLREALNLMVERQIGSVPVFDGRRPVGVVNATDVLDELGRDSARQPFPGWVPRRIKREAGREAATPVAHIRMLGATLTEEKREEVRRKLGAKLGRFADAIERVSVRVKDVNGPRGGMDQLCTIKVVLSDLPSVVFESQHQSLDAAVRTAITGTERAVRRRLQRKRMKPRKKQSPPSRVKK